MEFCRFSHAQGMDDIASNPPEPAETEVEDLDVLEDENGNPLTDDFGEMLETPKGAGA